MLTHYLGESGADQVNQLLASGPGKIALCAISWVELDRRLTELVDDEAERSRVFRLYTEALTSAVPVNVAVAREAIRLMASCPARVPLVDGLIAASAVHLGLILVHRDKHMDAIADKRLQSIRLPDKA